MLNIIHGAFALSRSTTNAQTQGKKVKPDATPGYLYLYDEDGTVLSTQPLHYLY
jgi:hypothetical protein